MFLPTQEWLDGLRRLFKAQRSDTSMDAADQRETVYGSADAIIIGDGLHAIADAIRQLSVEIRAAQQPDVELAETGMFDMAGTKIGL